MRNAAPGGPPCGRADPWIARDHRPMTLAGAPLGAPPRHFWRNFRFAAAPGRASGNRHLRRPVQRAPRRAVVVPPGSLPGAARVQAYEACPQGPPLAPSAERRRKTPLSERGGRLMYKIPLKIKEYYHNKIVIGKGAVTVARMSEATCGNAAPACRFAHAGYTCCRTSANARVVHCGRNPTSRFDGEGCPWQKRNGEDGTGSAIGVRRCDLIPHPR